MIELIYLIRRSLKEEVILRLHGELKALESEDSETAELDLEVSELAKRKTAVRAVLLELLDEIDLFDKNTKVELKWLTKPMLKLLEGVGFRVFLPPR